MPNEIGVYSEWRSKNSGRRYPFADDSPVTTDSGYVLDNSVFVDARLFPQGVAGDLRLSRLDVLSSTAELSDSSGVAATAELDGDIFVFYDLYGRCIGCMVVGAGYPVLAAALTFPEGSAVLSPDCTEPQTYDCLEGLLLPDGTLVSGDVVWEGENGITVTTEYVDGVPVVRIDAVGDPDPDCGGLTPPIKCIRASQVGTGRPLLISQTESIIMLGTPYTLQEFCAMFPYVPDEDGKLPVSDDACTTPPVVPCIPPDPTTYACPTEPHKDYYLWPMSDTIGLELVELLPVFDPASQALNAGLNIPGSLPPRAKQGLKIFMKGAVND